MLNLRESPAHEEAPRPTTSQDRRNAIVFVVLFLVWLPLYLVVVRPLLNAVIFELIPSYPAMAHLFPIFGIPWVVTELFERASRGRARSGD